MPCDLSLVTGVRWRRPLFWISHQSISLSVGHAAFIVRCNEKGVTLRQLEKYEEEKRQKLEKRGKDRHNDSPCSPLHYLLFDSMKALVVLILSLHTGFTECSNWAQTSGRLDQNIVITKIPSADNLHWAARYGHATSILNTGALPEIGEVYLSGGDVYTQSRDQETNIGVLATTRFLHACRTKIHTYMHTLRPLVQSHNLQHYL